MNDPLSLYLHFPYCWSKCHYCAFNSIRYDKPQSLRFLTALKKEIARYGDRPEIRGRRIATVYMGGGTPSIFHADQILDVLDHARRHFYFGGALEMTVEANPGTVDREKLTALRAGGVNRLSLGVQSFHDQELAWLGRAHTSRVAREAYGSARAAGFENVNLDFMYALPGQRLEDWNRTLDEAIGLGPEHLSAYALTIEEGTRFGADYDRGLLVLPDEDRQIRFDEWTRAKLAGAGYRHYEVSNYARPGYACRHNLGYWGQQEYLGLGPGAHSYMGGRRFSKLENIGDYIRDIEKGGDAIEESESIGPDLAFREALIFGLRKTDGIRLDEIRRRYPSTDSGRLQQTLEKWSLDELIVLDPPRVRLSSKGLRLWDRIAEEIIAVR
ncbi:MAG TPA: radical SAM family heme chaperone HemW [Nitrospiria bacterium]|jgi:oxygen-independent coproporphyrinogen-3 oxidase|nr:radical SAM family heme chaperone HemW [Nitrospiria bacterium]